MSLTMTLAIKVIVLYIFLGVVLSTSALIVNLIQTFLYVSLFYVNRNLYRKINYYLGYSLISEIVGLFEWRSNFSCNLYGEEEDLKKFGKEHSIVLMNHKYDIDWITLCVVADKLKNLGNVKGVIKKSLRTMPISGWTLFFTENVFLERNWEKDRLSFGKQLDNLMEYEYPMMLLLFCEGTRFTKEKHAASMDVARAKGVPELKHHLLPRTKGFNFAARHLKEKTNAIYDVQLAFAPGFPTPTISQILLGYRFVGEMFVRRIPISQIPTYSDEETSAWLYKLYQEKDSIMEGYFKTNRFPGKCIKLRRRIYPILNLLFWSISVGFSGLYLLFQMFISGNNWLIIVASIYMTIGLATTYLSMRATRIQNSSSYGKLTSTDTKERLTIVN